MATTTERPLADALTAIKTRRSVKEYVPTEIPREWIEELLDAAHWAPNHKLTHPWRFHVFSGEGRERLVGARQAAVHWAAEKKGQQASEDALRFARAKCYSSSVIIVVSMVGDENKIVDQENFAEPAGARFRTCWSRRPREAWAAIPARAPGSTKTSLAQFSDSQRRSGRWRPFSWGTPSRRLWPSACPWSAIPPGTPRPESSEGSKSTFSLSGDRLSRSSNGIRSGFALDTRSSSRPA